MLGRFGLLCFLGICVLGSVTGMAQGRESVRIAGAKVPVGSIELTTNISIKGNSSVQNLYYTFYLDKRDLDIADSYVPRYLKGSNSYKRMAAIILLYVKEEFAKYPCVGRNKCVKNIRVGIDTFFAFLNAHPEYKTKYLEASTSFALISPKYRRVDDFIFDIALKAGYALYGISYMRVNQMIGWTLLDKMIYSIRYDGYNGGL